MPCLESAAVDLCEVIPRKLSGEREDDRNVSYRKLGQSSIHLQEICKSYSTVFSILLTCPGKEMKGTGASSIYVSDTAKPSREAFCDS